MEGLPEFFTALGPRPSMTKEYGRQPSSTTKTTTPQPAPNPSQNTMWWPNNNKNWMVFLIIFVWVVLGRSLYDCCCCFFLLFLFRILLSFDFLLVHSVRFHFRFVFFFACSIRCALILSFFASNRKKNKTDKLKKTLGRMDRLKDGWRDKPTSQRASR